jgi:hypothetical protein
MKMKNITTDSKAEAIFNQLPEELKKMFSEQRTRNSRRYIEVVGGIGMCRHELLDGEPVAGYTGYGRRVQGDMVWQVLEIGKFTRKNVAKWLEIVSGPECRPIEDFHAVCDDIDIPWATERGKAIWTTVMVEGKPRTEG